MQTGLSSYRGSATLYDVTVADDPEIISVAHTQNEHPAEMMTVIHNLQDAVERYLASGAQATAAESMAIIDTCGRLLSDLASIQRAYQTPGLLQFSINQCYLLLVSVLDKAWISDIPADLFDTLLATLLSFEDIYDDYINIHNKLSLAEQDKLHKSSLTLLIQLRPKLEAKHVPDSYITEIENALTALFKCGKLPHLHYYHRRYLQVFMHALSDIAHEKRNKDWGKRFVFLLIRYNFNYPGFFNRWHERLSDTLAQMDDPEQRYEYLCEVEDILRRSVHENSLRFDNSRRPLLADMLTHIKKTIVSARIEREEDEQDRAAALDTTLTGKELNLLFFYLYKFKVVDYPNKREASKAFSTFIHSKTKRKISYKTLEKFEKADLETSAIKVRRLLRAIIDSIDQDFRD